MDRYSHDQGVEADAESIDSQRVAARDSLLLTAPFRVDGGAPVQVRVRNLSAGGMMAEYAKPVTVGTPVAADLRGIGWVQGQVAWCAEGRLGVAFAGPIDPMAARKPVGKGGHTPHYVKPILPLR